MFQSLWYSIRVEMIRLRRNPVTYLCLAGIIALTVRWLRIDLGTKDHVQSLIRIGVIFGQGGFLVSMCMGAYLASGDNDRGISDVVYAMPQAYAIKTVARILSLALAAACATALLVITYYTAFALTDANSYFYTAALPFLSQTILFPVIIAGVLGGIIGIWLPVRYSFFAILPVWVLFSPYNRDVYAHLNHRIFGLSVEWMDKIFYRGMWTDFLRMGQGERIGTQTTPAYGLSMEPQRFWAMAIVFAVALTMFVLSLLLKMRRSVRRAALAISLVLALLIAVLIPGASYVRANERFYAQFMSNDNRMSSPLDSVPYEWWDPLPTGVWDENALHIDSMDIELTMRHVGMSARVAIDGRWTRPVDAQAFALTTDYTVKQVLYNGESIGFIQERDRVMLEFGDTQPKAQAVQLVFEYEGLGSTVFSTGYQSVMLLRDYQWLPMPGYISYNLNDVYEPFLTAAPLQGELIEYKVRVNTAARATLLCDLPAVGERAWAGRSLRTPVIVGGYGVNATREGLNAYIPISVSGLEDYLTDGFLVPLARDVGRVGEYLETSALSVEQACVVSAFASNYSPKDVMISNGLLCFTLNYTGTSMLGGDQFQDRYLAHYRLGALGDVIEQSLPYTTDAWKRAEIKYFCAWLDAACQTEARALTMSDITQADIVMKYSAAEFNLSQGDQSKLQSIDTAMRKRLLGAQPVDVRQFLRDWYAALKAGSTASFYSALDIQE